MAGYFFIACFIFLLFSLIHHVQVLAGPVTLNVLIYLKDFEKAAKTNVANGKNLVAAIRSDQNDFIFKNEV